MMYLHLYFPIQEPNTHRNNLQVRRLSLERARYRSSYLIKLLVYRVQIYIINTMLSLSHSIKFRDVVAKIF